MEEKRLKLYTIMNKKVMKKKEKERGSFDFRSEGNLEVVRWNYNLVVTLVSNSVG